MKKEDPDASGIIIEKFRSEGIDLRLNHPATAVDVLEGKKLLICEHEGKQIRIEFDEILIALGRTPNVTGFGLEEMGVELTGSRHIETNDFLQTNFPNIYCSGDVHGRYPW